jgi:hypothetical protein
LDCSADFPLCDEVDGCGIFSSFPKVADGGGKDGELAKDMGYGVTTMSGYTEHLLHSEQ